MPQLRLVFIFMILCSQHIPVTLYESKKVHDVEQSGQYYYWAVKDPSPEAVGHLPSILAPDSSSCQGPIKVERATVIETVIAGKGR